MNICHVFSPFSKLVNKLINYFLNSVDTNRVLFYNQTVIK
uniref:Uncharacterized protein n=1 Tax=Siphoviridae sp. ct9Dg3 TaxID=2827792 RepID=A0A8S5TL62_9CAUD|nr:MAG TPA: hypothetical protein [Siphoviridae sp. ct9Dg3]